MSVSHFLLFVTTILACGSIALIFVRRSADRFSALGWVAAALASGAISTTLLLEPVDVLGGVLPDLMLLLSFIFLQMATVSLCDKKVGLPRLGAYLLIVEVITGICLNRGLGGIHLRAEVLGAVLAVQAGETLFTAVQVERKAHSGPVLLVAFDLVCFMLFHLARSFELTFLQTPDHYLLDNNSEVLVAVYLLSMLGFALGFFWLSTELQAFKLEDMAGTDPLTRAANRRNFLVWCEQERERSMRTGAPYSIVMVDIDRFKSINDTFGHAVGDAVICDVVEKMRNAIRGLDVLGRWGGEEFILLLRESDLDAARVVAERIRASVEFMDPSAPALRYGDTQRKITVSVGIAGRRTDEGILDLIARADTALYAAKTGGRNRVQASGDAAEEEVAQLVAAGEAEETPAFTVPKRFSRLHR